MDPLHQLKLRVGLTEFERTTARRLAAHGLNLREGGGAVNRRLALAQAVQVGAVQDVNGRGRRGTHRRVRHRSRGANLTSNEPVRTLAKSNVRVCLRAMVSAA